jgi:gluconolactonase
MKRIFSCSLILASAFAAYACSKSTTSSNPGTGESSSDPTVENGATPNTGDGTPAVEAGVPGPAPGTPDPTGNPIYLGPPRTVRTFAPPGVEPLYVDGPQWVALKDALYVALPYETNLTGGKGILTTFKSDGTFYSELRAGDTHTTGVIGNSVDAQGNLISAELKTITRTTMSSGTVTVIAAGYGQTAHAPDAAAPALTPFDGPNDLVALQDGTIFFTDPGYDINPRPLVGHVFMISPTGVATIADSYDNNPSPNGIALSKDEKTLYIGFTSPGEGTLPFVRKYTVNADRSLADMGKLFELPDGSEPDGMAIDDNDNIYVALNTGIAVFKVTGEPYGGAGAKIPQTELAGASAVTFGGADRKSLYATATGKVVEFRTSVPGLVQ